MKRYLNHITNIVQLLGDKGGFSLSLFFFYIKLMAWIVEKKKWNRYINGPLSLPLIYGGE